MGYVASVAPAPQAPLAGLEVEPDVPGVASTLSPVTRGPLGHDPAHPTAPLRCAAGAGRLDRIRKRIAAIIPWPAGHLLRPRHRLGDPFRGQLRCHRCATPGGKVTRAIRLDKTDALFGPETNQGKLPRGGSDRFTGATEQ